MITQQPSFLPQPGALAGRRTMCRLKRRHRYQYVFVMSSSSHSKSGTVSWTQGMLSLRIDLKGSSEMIGGAPSNGGGDEAAEGGGVDAANGGGGDCNLETQSHPSARPRHPQAAALVHEEGAFADGGRRTLLGISNADRSSNGSSSAGGGTKVTRRP